ncbi:MAG: radical SAM protein [Methanobacteriaceae archaeon]|nr:radical SAM protein [Methanobacteriaceae archaeon]
MKVLFLNLPYEFNISRASRWPEKTKSGTLYYPYWLSYCVGVCKSYDLDVKLVDCITKEYDLNDTLNEISTYVPDYIMCETTTPTCDYDYNTINAIKNKFHNIKIICGGTHPTILPEEVLKKCDGIDFVVRQEYDYTVPEIIQAGDNFIDVDGISFKSSLITVDNITRKDIIKSKDGKIIHTPDRVPLEDLDKLPYVSKVYQEFLDVNDYAYAFAQKPMIQIVSSRGCPNKCNFCSYPSTMGGRLYRTRSVKDLADEFEYILNEMPEIKEIFIEDDTFTVDQDRVIDFCNELISRNLKSVWSCNTRVDLKYDTMKKMKEAGCRLLVCGYESGNQDVLDQTQKGITLEQSSAFAKNARKLDIKVFGCFMIGLTGDNLDTINETYEFAKTVYPDMCFFQQAVPFPGTGFYKWAKENNYLITEDYGKWLNDDGYLNCLVDYPYADHKEIEKIRDNLMSKYYFSFAYIGKTFLANLDWTEFKRVMRGGTQYIAFRFKKMLHGNNE